MSELHCNFLINLGNATAADIEGLGEAVRERVKENSGVELEWEIKRIGVAASHANENKTNLIKSAHTALSEISGANRANQIPCIE